MIISKKFDFTVEPHEASEIRRFLMYDCEKPFVYFDCNEDNEVIGIYFDIRDCEGDDCECSAEMIDEYDLLGDALVHQFKERLQKQYVI